MRISCGRFFLEERSLKDSLSIEEEIFRGDVVGRRGEEAEAERGEEEEWGEEAAKDVIGTISWHDDWKNCHK